MTVWKVGLVSNAEQPEPAPLQADSVQPRVVPVDRVSEVPPTAVTNRDVAGYSAPLPSSPELTVMATPGWLKLASSLVSLDDSSPPQLLETNFACAAA